MSHRVEITLSNGLVQSLPPEDFHYGLTTKDILYWHNTLRQLNISQDDALRLCNTIRDRACFVFRDHEADHHRRTGQRALPLAPIPKAARVGAVLPVDMCIPRHHDKFQYHGIAFILPVDYSEGPFYVITRGLLVGVFARWTTVAPLVINVKGSVYNKVSSAEEGGQIILDSIDDETFEYLSKN